LKLLFGSKHLDIWFTTGEIGIGIDYDIRLKTLFIHLIVFWIDISKNNEVDFGDLI